MRVRGREGRREKEGRKRMRYINSVQGTEKTGDLRGEYDGRRNGHMDERRQGEKKMGGGG